MGLDQQIRAAEERVFSSHGLRPEDSYLELAGVRLRVVSVGAGPPLVLLHGVSLAAAVWAPWLTHFTGYRAHTRRPGRDRSPHWSRSAIRRSPCPGQGSGCRCRC